LTEHLDSAKIVVHPPQGIPRELVVGFLSRCEKSIGNAYVDLDRREYEALCVYGHRLKGSGGAYGIPHLTEIGAAIETAARAQDSGELARWVTGLESYLRQLEVA
jgi:HPt (histidine-containing phosphotransfer) domain-containing protein